MRLEFVEKDFKCALQDVLDEHPIQHVLIGTRRTDPHAGLSMMTLFFFRFGGTVFLCGHRLAGWETPPSRCCGGHVGDEGVCRVVTPLSEDGPRVALLHQGASHSGLVLLGCVAVPVPVPSPLLFSVRSWVSE